MKSTQKRHRCVLLSDFTIDNFAAYLNEDQHFPSVEGTVVPFGRMMEVLLDRKARYWTGGPDSAMIWTTPEGPIKSFSDLLMGRKTSIKNIFKEVDEYSSLLLNIQERVKVVLVPIWTLVHHRRGSGMLNMRLDTGAANTLMRMNIRLSENLAKTSNIYLLDAQRWVEMAGGKAFNPKLWYMAKVAFGNEVFLEAVKDVKSAIRGIMGGARKMIIMDLDDTLWGGPVGDLGWQNIRLGGHDYIGEAYRDFQLSLKSLSNRGVLLGMVSKNDEESALKAINEHPEMILRLNDFAGWKINWKDKTENIIDLVSDLNIGLDSVVFIDDNPSERARVKEALPEIIVPEWPRDPMLYTSALSSLDCFNTPFVSKEDRERTKGYVSERKRKELKDRIGSPDEWLRSLKIKVTIEDLDRDNLQRAAQLLNKTNQMNLSTRRLTESELIDWAENRSRKIWVFNVVDRFGNSGLTGMISIEMNEGAARVVDFILSCRMFGRRIEEVMLCKAIRHAKSEGMRSVNARYIPTEKNKPCLSFFKNSCFRQSRNNLFIYNLTKARPFPRHTEIDDESLRGGPKTISRRKR